MLHLQQAPLSKKRKSKAQLTAQERFAQRCKPALYIPLPLTWLDILNECFDWALNGIGENRLGAGVNIGHLVLSYVHITKYRCQICFRVTYQEAPPAVCPWVCTSTRFLTCF